MVFVKILSPQNNFGITQKVWNFKKLLVYVGNLDDIWSHLTTKLFGSKTPVLVTAIGTYIEL